VLGLAHLGSARKSITETEMRIFRHTSLSFLLALAICGVAQPASAATNGAWSVFPVSPPPTKPGAALPAYFTPLLRPGSTYRAQARVSNLTTVAMTFNVYVADAFNTSSGAFSLRRRTDPKIGVAKWARLDRNRLTLKPNSAVDLTLTIRPPLNASPGDHPGGIVIEPARGTFVRRGAVGLTVLQAVGVRIYARVAGPLHPKLAIPMLAMHRTHGVSALVGGKVDETITYTVKNSGNVRLTPLAYLKVSPLLGHGVTVPRKTLPELLPGSSITVSQVVKNVRPYGRVHADLLVQARRGASAHATKNQLVIPWIVVALLLALVVGLVIRWRRRRARRNRTAPAVDLTQSVDVADDAESLTH
jgi:hypothetical protein